MILQSELSSARSQSQELRRTGELFDLILTHKPTPIRAEEEQQANINQEVSPESQDQDSLSAEDSNVDSTKNITSDPEKATDLVIPIEEIENLTSAKFPYQHQLEGSDRLAER